MQVRRPAFKALPVTRVNEFISDVVWDFGLITRPV